MVLKSEVPQRKFNQKYHILFLYHFNYLILIQIQASLIIMPLIYPSIIKNNYKEKN